MATTVKMMFNDKEAVLELAKDPEVQVKIKTAIVDEAAKRAAKAIQAALNSTIEDAVNLAMVRFLKGKPNDVVKRCDMWDRIVLSDKLMKAIQDAVDTKLTIAAFEYPEKFPENKELKKAIQRQIDYVNKVDMEKMIRESIDRLVKERFGGSKA